MQRDEWRGRLTQMAREQWDAFLRKHSGLPGPRANLELLHAAADAGELGDFRRWAAMDDEYLAACGAVGLGRVLAEGDSSIESELKALANDRRWRVREGVAMGLQRVGLAGMPPLMRIADEWRKGSWLEQRAVVAGLCEPALLKRETDARAVLGVLDAITARIAAAPAPERKRDDFRVLRQALGYGWSVAMVAVPAEGKACLERWLRSGDADVAWIMRENLKKNRLRKMDAAWVAAVGSSSARSRP